MMVSNFGWILIVACTWKSVSAGPHHRRDTRDTTDSSRHRPALELRQETAQVNSSSTFTTPSAIPGVQDTLSTIPSITSTSIISSTSPTPTSTSTSTFTPTATSTSTATASVTFSTTPDSTIGTSGPTTTVTEESSTNTKTQSAACTLEVETAHRTEYVVCPGTDRPGGDITEHFNIPDSATCLERCSEHPFCVGVVYGASSGICWLKWTLNPSVEDPNYGSAERVGVPDRISDNLGCRVTANWQVGNRRYLGCRDTEAVGAKVGFRHQANSVERCLERCNEVAHNEAYGNCIGVQTEYLGQSWLPVEPVFLCTQLVTAPGSVVHSDGIGLYYVVMTGG